jgi:hypothetical protein
MSPEESRHERNRIGDVMVRVRQVVGSGPGRIKPKTMKLVFVASPLSTQY